MQVQVVIKRGRVRGSGELRRLVTVPGGEGEGAWTIAFCMFPVSVDQVMKVADAEQLLPPKLGSVRKAFSRGSKFVEATWFEPKLRSGLVARTLDETR